MRSLRWSRLCSLIEGRLLVSSVHIRFGSCDFRCSRFSVRSGIANARRQFSLTRLLAGKNVLVLALISKTRVNSFVDARFGSEIRILAGVCFENARQQIR